MSELTFEDINKLHTEFIYNTKFVINYGNWTHELFNHLQEMTADDYDTALDDKNESVIGKYPDIENDRDDIIKQQLLNSVDDIIYDTFIECKDQDLSSQLFWNIWSDVRKDGFNIDCSSQIRLVKCFSNNHN